MTELQFVGFLNMLCGVRVALLGIVDAIEVLLVANGKLTRRTSEIRRQLKSQGDCGIMAAENP